MTAISLQPVCKIAVTDRLLCDQCQDCVCRRVACGLVVNSLQPFFSASRLESEAAGAELMSWFLGGKSHAYVASSNRIVWIVAHRGGAAVDRPHVGASAYRCVGSW
jgi:hypothetical protein